MEIYMETPFYGVPRLTAELKHRGYRVNHKRVYRLQKCLNLRTVYPRPHFNTSGPHPGHEKFPYLLHKCKIERPNQVWSTDITYTAVAGHRAFVIGIVDWFSRKVLAYNLDNAKMERFWWALKYEDIKIKEYVSLPQLRFRVQHYVNFYNSRRIHLVLQYQTPDEVYFGICNRQAMGYSNSKAFAPIF